METSVDISPEVLIQTSIENTIEEAPVQFLNSGFDEHTIRVFIGDSADYYISKWTKAQEPEKTPSFSWGGLLFPRAWFGYRKMYKNMFLYIIVLNIGVVMPDILFGSFMEATSAVMIFARVTVLVLLRLYLAMYANALYYKHAMGTLKKFQSTNTESEGFNERVKKAGGISEFGLLFALFIPFLTKFLFGIVLIR